jgi:HK97 family phage major capsid protein
VEARLWGLPVVDTPAMAVDSFLVGAFRFGATLYDRMGVEILISTENADDFEKNLATMRAEERIALAVKRPASFVVGDFGLVP